MFMSNWLEKAALETATRMSSEGIAGDVQVSGVPAGFFVTRDSPFERVHRGEILMPLSKFEYKGEMFYAFQALRPKAQ